MSYDIYIGNAELAVLEGLDDQPSSYYIRVNEMEHPDAPTFPNDDMTGNGNSRHPGYSQWTEFTRTAGLYDLFFNQDDGLMVAHPGNAALRPEHAKEIHKALERWQARHPDATPGFEAFAWGDEVPKHGYDPILARLIWLDWWVDYALKHCERPCIYNH